MRTLFWSPAPTGDPYGIRLEECAPRLKVPPAKGSAALKSSSPQVPAENASRVLPRALWKTPPTSAADMASEFLASIERTAWEEVAQLHTTQPPAQGRPHLLLGAGPAGGIAGLDCSGAASVAWAGRKLERPLWDRLRRLASGDPHCAAQLRTRVSLGSGWEPCLSLQIGLLGLTNKNTGRLGRQRMIA